MAFEDYWNKSHEKYLTEKPTYDNWLDKYLSLLSNTHKDILDLGCGTGNDTLYLIEKDFIVLACDYSDYALKSINKTIPKAKTMLLDMSKPFPFDNAQFDVIIADLSLHYFDEQTTKEVMKEIKRVLSSNGVLLARVNSVNDLNFGAGQGEKIEDNYYYVDGYNKRFFDENDINKYFGIIGDVSFQEAEMTRYSKPKKLIEVCVKKAQS